MGSASPTSARALAGLLLLLGACTRLSVSVDDVPASPRRALFFGSSTVQGTGASTPALRWTSLLSGRLGWEEINSGLGSSTLTPHAAERVPSGRMRWRDAIVPRHPDLVLLMYGANDIVAQVPIGVPTAPNTFRGALHEVLAGLREALPDARLVVVSPQPARWIAERRAPYDAALEEAARRFGALYVPGRSAFPASRLSRYAVDGLHLNDQGHAAFAHFVESRLAAHGLVASARPAPSR
jgi:lysophospholipase L1-like esterase